MELGQHSSLAELGHVTESVRLEANSACQLKCPLCPTGKMINYSGVVGWGSLKFEHFKQFIDNNPKVKHIELSNWGEIFLNPHIQEIIKYAHEKSISLTAMNGVNLNTVSRETLEVVVKYKFRRLSVSLDGASNDTYKIYRQGGTFEKVISNVKIINEFKAKYNTKSPELYWQFIIFGHNEHELLEAKKMAQELGMTFKPKLNSHPNWSPVRDKEAVASQSGIGASSRSEFEEKFKRNYLLPCLQFWRQPQINWDGKLLGCCINRYNDFGNVFEQGFENALKGEKFVYAKKMLIGEAPAREDIPCTKCPIYLKLKDNPLTEKEILEGAVA